MNQASKLVVLVAVGVVGAGGRVNSSGVTGGNGSSCVVGMMDGGSRCGVVGAGVAVGVVRAGSGVNSGGVTGSSGGSSVVGVDGGSGCGVDAAVAVGVVGAGRGVDASGPLTGNGGLDGVSLVVGQKGVVAQWVVRAGSRMHPSGVAISLAHNGDSHDGEDDLRTSTKFGQLFEYANKRTLLFNATVAEDKIV